MMYIQSTQKHSQISGYHPLTRWLHAGLVLGVTFQLICAAQMVHPEHADGGHAGPVVHAETANAHHSGHVEAGYAGATAHAEPVTREEAQHQPTDKKDALGEWLMEAHRTGGILVGWIVLANLLWAVMPRDNLRKRQISVLFSAQHWSEAGAILKHFPRMLAGKRDFPEPGNSLALIVEMLGILTMTAMAMTGSIIWSLWAGPGNTVSESVEFWMEIHAVVALLLMLCLAGHVSMALLHWRSGDSVFARIIPWSRR